MCKVVHWKKNKYDVYIARTSEGNIWSNPYSHKENSNILDEYRTQSREESLERFEEYLINNKELMDKLPDLMFKTLGCWCKGKNGKGGKKCHGDIITKYVNKLEYLEQRRQLLEE